MTANLGEVTPLVPRSNAEWQPASGNDNPASRRRHQSLNDFHNNHHHHPHDFGDDYEFVDRDDARKGASRHTRRQRLWGGFRRLVSSVAGRIPILRGQVRARTAEYAILDPTTTCSPLGEAQHEQQQMFYEDTYNDESWACSFGTREDVRIVSCGF